jgi:predicted nucleotidyltransferase
MGLLLVLSKDVASRLPDSSPGSMPENKAALPTGSGAFAGAKKPGIIGSMDKRLPNDPILARLKHDLEAMYGPRLKQLLLYGSRARGDFRDDSDYDVLVVLEGPLDWRPEMERLAGLSTRIGIETAGKAILSLKSVTPDDLQKRTGFMHNVRNEAIAI